MCIFCDIVERRSPAEIVFEDGATLAFLDVRPLFTGHTLLVPREHHETITDLPADQIPRLFANVQILSRVVQEGMSAEGTFIAMNNKVSQSVPHLHVHIVPRRKKDGLRGFFWPRRKYKDGEMEETGEVLRRTFEQMRTDDK